MNKKEFSVYLHKPNLIDKHAEIALQEVVTDFPYFHAAHQLLLKAHQNNGSYHFEKQLPIVSLLHGNRALLYEYLRDSLVKEFTHVAQEDPALTEESFNESMNLHQENLFGEVVELKDELQKIPSLDWAIGNDALESTHATDEKENEEVLNSLNITENNEKTNIEQEISGNEESELPFQNFEKKYLSQITVETESELQVVHDEKQNSALPEKLIASPDKINHSPLNFSIPDLPFQNFEEIYLNKTNEVNHEKSEIHIDTTEISSPFTEHVSSNNPVTKEEAKMIATIEPIDFLKWLQTKKSASTVNKPNPIAITEAPAIDENVNTDIALSGNDSPEEKKIKKFNDLIDRFIENSPSISKPQPSKFYNPAQKAKESVTENLDLVSETLAKIYIKQSNYKKAILVYEKLSLLYPEKFSYFAARISELQTLLNK